MKKLIGSWSFYKNTLMIAIPIMIQNLITNFVALIDNIMVGQIGTEQMSGVAIVNQILFVFNLTIFGAISGASIFCAQFFGKKDYDGVRHTFRFKLITVFAITFIGLIIFGGFGEKIINAYLHDSGSGIDVAKTFGYASDYMFIMLFGLLPFTFEQAYSSTLREGGFATLPMIAGIVAVITNTVLNFLLIFGIGVFPEMGVRGAAIATVISRVVQMGIVIFWTHIHSNEFEFVRKLYKSLKIPAELTRKICVKGLIPLTANECLWGAGVAMLTQCYSLRGIDVVAGINIASTVTNLFNVLYIAFGSGVAVVIGQLLGANKLEEAKESAPKLIFFSFLLCVGVGIITCILSPLFPLAYKTTGLVRSLATQFIIINAVFMPMHGILHPTYFTLRSGGKTVITFLFDCGFSWCICVPLAFCLARFTSLPIMPLYVCCTGIEILKCVAGIILIKKGVWLSNIVSEN